jgi:hypothetical protein
VTSPVLVYLCGFLICNIIVFDISFLNYNHVSLYGVLILCLSENTGVENIDCVVS